MDLFQVLSAEQQEGLVEAINQVIPLSRKSWIGRSCFKSQGDWKLRRREYLLQVCKPAGLTFNFNRTLFRFRWEDIQARSNLERELEDTFEKVQWKKSNQRKQFDYGSYYEPDEMNISRLERELEDTFKNSPWRKVKYIKGTMSQMIWISQGWRENLVERSNQTRRPMGLEVQWWTG